MQEFLTAIFTFPTVFFTSLLGVALLYWLTVILGVLDLDFLDGALGLDAVDSALDGALEVVDGAVEGGADTAAEAGDGDADGARGGLFGFLNALGLQGIPVTVTGSFLVLWGWVLSYWGLQLVGGLSNGPLTTVLLGGGVLVGSIAVSLLLSALCVRPLRRLFATQLAPGRASMVGKICVIRSLRVDEHAGQAEIEDGGAGFLAEVRCPQPNTLSRGSHALVFRYDATEEVFHVGPVDPGLVEASKLTRE